MEELSLDELFGEVENCFHFKPGRPNLVENESDTDTEGEEPKSVFTDTEEEPQSVFTDTEEEPQSVFTDTEEEPQSIFNFYDPRGPDKRVEIKKRTKNKCTSKSKKKLNECVSKDKITNNKVNKKAIYIKTLKGNRYLCPFCNKTFKSWGLGNAHVSKRHGGSKKTCEFCDYTTWNPDALGKHMKKHKFSSPSEKWKTPQKAIYIKTTEGNRYMCPFCKQIFRSCGLGNAHVSKWHGGTKKTCEFCDYTTWNPDALRKHMKKHNYLST